MTEGHRCIPHCHNTYLQAHVPQPDLRVPSPLQSGFPVTPQPLYPFYPPPSLPQALKFSALPTRRAAGSQGVQLGGGLGGEGRGLVPLRGVAVTQRALFFAGERDRHPEGTIQGEGLPGEARAADRAERTGS